MVLLVHTIASKIMTWIFNILLIKKMVWTAFSVYTTKLIHTLDVMCISGQKIAREISMVIPAWFCVMNIINCILMVQPQNNYSSSLKTI